MYSSKNNKKNSASSLKFSLVLVALMSSPLVSLAQPLEVKSEAVAQCNFIDTVEGSSGYGKKFNWMPEAKSTALNQASKLGASHVVWERFNPVGAFNGVAVAKVYKCNT